MNKMSFKGRSQQAGFTIIELIVVIVILGIMAATALPRFADMSTQAREAKAAAGAAAANSAAGIAHAAWLAAGSDDATVALEGAAAVTMSAAGYPTADAAGIGAATNLTGYGALGANGGYGTDDDHTSAQCGFSYDADTGVAAAVVTSC